jgi:quinol monooxygenase YgiN
VTVIVAGTFRVPPENLDAIWPHLTTVITATRAEDGCLVYSYGKDAVEPSLIRVFEVWRDQASVDAHFQTAHMKTWQAERAKFGLFDRRITAYEVASQTDL